MNRPILIGYQLSTGLSNALTGVLLILAPEFTLALMGLHVPADTLPYQSFIGAFVFSIGLAGLYGARGMILRDKRCRLEVVWMLTAFTGASIAVFVAAQILTHRLEVGWVTVAFSDGACVLVQAVGLRKGWLAHVAR